MYLSRVEIGNFIGIRSTRIDFDETTVLIGENDSGKSTVLLAIEKVLAPNQQDSTILIEEHEFHYHLSGDRYIPSGPIRIALTFRERVPDEWSYLKENELGITFIDDPARQQELTIEVTAYPGHNSNSPQWKLIVPGVDTSNLKNDPAVLSWIRRTNPVFHIRGGLLIGREENGNQISSSVKPIPDANTLINTIQGHIDNLLQGTAPDVHAELKAGYNAAMYYLKEASGLLEPEGLQEQKIIREILGKHAEIARPGESRVPFHHGSTAEMIGMLLFTIGMLNSGTFYADPSSEPIFILEDPEANLHPMTLESVRLMIDRLKYQKIITTQSGNFLSGFSIQAVRRLTRQNGVVRQYRIEPGTLGREDLRRLSYHIRMRSASATFARCWLLVEGESEIWLIPHIARLCGYELAMEGVACVEFAQCGIAPLIKAARQLGIEWHVMADGDSAGRDYANTAKYFASQDNDDYKRRCTRLREKDIEHCLYFNGYSNVYLEYAGMNPESGQKYPPGRIIGRAIHRNSKPFMAIAVVEAMAREGSPGVPQILKKMVDTCIDLAKGQS